MREGRTFTIRIDHKPLILIFNQCAGKAVLMQAFVAELHCAIFQKYCPRRAPADMLSRPDEN